LRYFKLLSHIWQKMYLQSVKELDCPAVRALGVRSRKQSNIGWSSDGWPKFYHLELIFGRHVKPLVPAVFAVVNTHQSALGSRGWLWHVLLMVGTLIGWWWWMSRMVGYGPFSLWVIHKEGLCPSSRTLIG
jgi:hypothetical protein